MLNHRHESDDSNFIWMRAVTAEKASNTLANWNRLLNKPRPENKIKGNAIKEWIYQQNPGLVPQGFVDGFSLRNGR